MSNMDLEGINSLFESMNDYVDSFIIIMNEKTHEVDITFTYISYDYIDKDVDFNHEYYSHLMTNFHVLLQKECIDLVKCEKFKKFKLSSGIKQMKYVYVKYMVITIDNNSITNQSYYTKLC